MIESNSNMKDSKNNKLSLKFDNKTQTNTISFKSKVMKFPFNMPCQINQFEVFMQRKGVEPNSDPDEKPRYTGGLSGVFQYTKTKKLQKFQFKIPFSLKYSTAIALSIRNGEIQDKKVQQLNKFVFGDEEIKPIIIDLAVWLQMFAQLIKQSSFPQSVKEKVESLEKSFKQNNIIVNILLDFTEKQFHFGLYWGEIKIDGMPEQLKLKNILFGLRLDYNKDHEEKKHAIKIGGQADIQYKEKEESIKASIYAQFSKDNEEVRLEVGATLSAITGLLGLMGVRVPSQISSFGQDLMISIQWIGDSRKSITQTMNQNSQ